VVACKKTPPPTELQIPSTVTTQFLTAAAAITKARDQNILMQSHHRDRFFTGECDIGQLEAMQSAAY